MEGIKGKPDREIEMKWLVASIEGSRERERWVADRRDMIGNRGYHMISDERSRSGMIEIYGVRKVRQRCSVRDWLYLSLSWGGAMSLLHLDPLLRFWFRHAGRRAFELRAIDLGTRRNLRQGWGARRLGGRVRRRWLFGFARGFRIVIGGFSGRGRHWGKGRPIRDHKEEFAVSYERYFHSLGEVGALTEINQKLREMRFKQK